jgi:hypothetical protein
MMGSPSSPTHGGSCSVSSVSMFLTVQLALDLSRLDGNTSRGSDILSRG